jgi:pilus assembly protein Flp/PilA
VLAVRIMGRKLRSDKRGATAIEYGLIAALIAVAAISGMSSLGGGANGMWGRLDQKIEDSMN